jgi:hypothetical protein
MLILIRFAFVERLKICFRVSSSSFFDTGPEGPELED